MTTEIQKGQYQHYKGKIYEVIAVGKDCETLEDVVVYKALYQTEDFPMGQIWTRTIEDFVATVEVDGEKVPRFKHV